MKVELLEEALAAIWGEAHLAFAAATSGRFPVKAIADILGVARSSLIDQLTGRAKRRDRYKRQGDDELVAGIRQLTDIHLTARSQRCQTAPAEHPGQAWTYPAVAATHFQMVPN